MPKYPVITAMLCICSLALATPSLARSGMVAAASPTPSALPVIYHIVVTPLCARLHDRIRPVIAMILQNDQTIGKSPKLFAQYSGASLASLDVAANPQSSGAPPINDSINNESPATSMALQQMSYLVHPIAENLIAAQTMLDDPALTKPTGNPNDDKALHALRDQLLETVAFQSASLDLINGFVQTQQMGEIQHAGTEYLGAIQGGNNSEGIIQNTPSPLQDPNAPGLPANPYNIDVTSIPGLAVGYNPISRVVGGLQWLRDGTSQREDKASTTLTAAMKACSEEMAPSQHP